MTVEARKNISRMILEVNVGDKTRETIMIARGDIREGKHGVDMKQSMMENMEENVDMKVQGGHLVCDSDSPLKCNLFDQVQNNGYF